jgi:protein TonB
MKNLILAALIVFPLLGLGQTDSVSKKNTIQFSEVDSKPVFPGCEEFVTEEGKAACFQKSLVEHVAKNFSYPENARKLKIFGKVFVNFVIETDGKVSSVSIARGLQSNEQSKKERQAAADLEQECLRVVGMLPSMKPASHKGKNVRMQFTMPINARLN